MPHQEQKLCLAVDDDEFIINVFERAFDGQTDYVLDTAKSVKTAIEKIHYCQYAIVFLDMKMGHSYAGMEVLEELRKVEIEQEAQGRPFLSTRVVIMSGSICLNDISKEAHSLDVFTFLDKGLTFDEKFIRRVLNKLGVPLLPRRACS